MTLIDIIFIVNNITEMIAALTLDDVKADIKTDNIICDQEKITILNFDVSEKDSQRWIDQENSDELTKLLKMWNLIDEN